MKISDVSHVYERYKNASIIRTIAEDDAMWNTGQEWYFYVGESGLNCILAALVLSRLETVTSVLDLPCGHGRVSRHIRSAFPDAELAFCDVDPKSVYFCATHFN